MDTKILIIGASGQIGTELTLKLRKIYGRKNVVAADIRNGNYEVMESGPFEILDALKKKEIIRVVKKHKINQIYLMAAMLSAIAEKRPKKAWTLNMNSLFNVLEVAKSGLVDKVFWPSSIAVFGPDSPKQNTPQDTIMNPTTVFGICMVDGFNCFNYYNLK